MDGETQGGMENSPQTHLPPASCSAPLRLYRVHSMIALLYGLPLALACHSMTVNVRKSDTEPQW